MVTRTLVDIDIDLGRRITAALIDSDFPCSGVLWVYLHDVERWQLLVVTRMVDDEGAFNTYFQLNKLLREKGLFDEMPVGMITAVSPEDRQIKALRSVAKTGRGIFGSRFSGSVDGGWIEDAYIFMLK